MPEFDRDPSYGSRLLDQLRGVGREVEWIEFKENKANPEKIAQYISALANVAALLGRPFGYLVWGIADGSLEVVGTTFDPWSCKKGGEDLHNWLARVLEPAPHFQFIDVDSDGNRVVVLEITASVQRPVAAGGVPYVRVGTNLKVLRKNPTIEKRLWAALDATPFERQLVISDAPADTVLALLDHESYFHMTGQAAPAGQDAVLSVLEADNLVQANEAGRWSITSLGALLFARDISEFDRLARKAVRFVQYAGETRAAQAREAVDHRGYANGFEDLIERVNSALPSNEVMGIALRKDVPAYPPLAIRELVANALIHQDLTISGSGPMIEVFDTRLEITNPGKPINDPRRLIDLPPISRNEALAGLMRRMGVCEERGSGWDRVMFEIEFNQLPAPAIDVSDLHTRISLFTPRPLAEMEKAERIEAVYLHACLMHVSHQRTTNESIRNRFGIAKKNSAQASRLLGDALEVDLIRPYDPSASRKYMSYQPYWA